MDRRFTRTRNSKDPWEGGVTEGAREMSGRGWCELRVEKRRSYSLSSCNLDSAIVCGKDKGGKAWTSRRRSGVRPKMKKLRRKGGVRPTM